MDRLAGRPSSRLARAVWKVKRLRCLQSVPAIKVWCQPAFANNCVPVRSDTEIVCVSLAA